MILANCVFTTSPPKQRMASQGPMVTKRPGKSVIVFVLRFNHRMEGGGCDDARAGFPVPEPGPARCTTQRACWTRGLSYPAATAILLTVFGPLSMMLL
jgi:hypothetical protein